MPENTIPAMKNALDMDVNTLEFDLQLSKDLQVVVSHDAYFHERYSTRPDGSLVKKSDPKEYIFTMPYDSVAKYDVGLRKVERWPNQEKMAVVKLHPTSLILPKAMPRSLSITTLKSNPGPETAKERCGPTTRLSATSAFPFSFQRTWESA